MKPYSGAQLAVNALEQLGIKHTFGIPGVHNTELYDELANSEQITPILVTHELSAAFMADAISRTTGGVGCIAIVPGAGLTHAMSGIAEASLDGIPMLIISGGVKRHASQHYQLHQIDQLTLAASITKEQYLIREHRDIMPTIFQAWQTAQSDLPGPVLIEIPFEIMNFTEQTELLPAPDSRSINQQLSISDQLLNQAVATLQQAKRPGIYVGWGAIYAHQEMIQLAELLQAPVATTLQGLSAFPATHPLHVGLGFGKSATPAGAQAFKDCDCLLVIGARFSELATGSYSIRPPAQLIHVDIDPTVFNKNFPASLAIHADARVFSQRLLACLKTHTRPTNHNLTSKIKHLKQHYLEDAKRHQSNGKVNPALFFEALQTHFKHDPLIVTDDGNHTFLTAELLPINQPRHFISPTDFNAMGYATPAAIACQLAFPEKQVIAIVGDGAFQMTGMETLTASQLGLPILYCIFKDRALGQIAQFQKKAYAQTPCTQLPDLDLSSFARACGCSYQQLSHNAQLGNVLRDCLALLRQHKPVILEINIDYSRPTAMTKGASITTLSRFPFKEKVRFITRAAKRNLFQR